jgi:hypothetical protein
VHVGKGEEDGAGGDDIHDYGVGELRGEKMVATKMNVIMEYLMPSIHFS